LDKWIKNHLNRTFNREQPMEALVSGLTYVKVADIVVKAISKINNNLKQIALFHTDRGKEFDNKLIDKVLKSFEIERSLSTKGCHYDNAIVEATMKAMRTEFLK